MIGFSFKYVMYNEDSMQNFPLKCTKTVVGRGSAPDPAGGAYDAPPDPLVGFALRALGSCASRTQCLHASHQRASYALSSILNTLPSSNF